ncbi:MAG: L-rhamnose mutarotase [Methylococcaceae bacterium]
MPERKRICYALDLVDEPDMIQTYENYHKPGNVWPEIIESIRASGIENMEIYRVQNRLFMIMTVSEKFDKNSRAHLDTQSSKVQEWEDLMSRFQLPLPGLQEGVKWVEMTSIFNSHDKMH